MSNAPTPGSGASGAPRILFAFFAGVLAVLVAREPALWLAGHLLPEPVPAAFATDPLAPLGWPRLLVTALVGGLWGVVLARLIRRDPAPIGRLVKGLVFGALAPSLVGWVVEEALRSHQLRWPTTWQDVAPLLLANGAWGLAAVALLDPLIGARRAKSQPMMTGRRR